MMSNIPYPVELVIEGTPISLQGSPESKARWRQRVSECAKARLREMTDWYFLDDRPVSVTIFYFPEAKMAGDIDNLVKNILDGLKSVVYPNDDVVERVVAQKFEPDVLLSFTVGSEQLGRALDAPRPVTYIRIDDHLRWRQAP